MAKGKNDKTDKSKHKKPKGKPGKGGPVLVPPKVIIITGGLLGGEMPVTIRSDEEFHPPGGAASTEFVSENAGRLIGFSISDPNFTATDIGLKGPTRLSLLFEVK